MAEHPREDRSRAELMPGVHGDCTGALYLEGSSTLLIADAHLGYAWAQRRRGELGPLTDGGIGTRIRSAMERWQPKRLVFLGDLVHLGRPGADERRFIEETLRETLEMATVHVVLGNHDRRFEWDFGHLPLTLGYEWRDERVVAVHGDREWVDTEKLLVLGHLHPAIGLQDAVGVRQRLPVFLIGERALVLPAFSPFAAGFDLRKPLPAEWRLLFGDEEVHLAAITGTQIRRVPGTIQLRYQAASVART